MLFAAAHESAIGTKRTCVGALHMSAFGGKADIAVGGVLSLQIATSPDVTRVTYKFFHNRYEWMLESKAGA